ADRDRVLGSLTSALGESALAGDTGRPAASNGARAARFVSRGWLYGGLSTLAVGTALIFGARLWRGTPPHAPPSLASSSVATRAPADVARTSPGGESGLPPPSPRGGGGPPARATSAHSPAQTSDSLAEEVRLLSKAQQELSRGQTDEALKT